MTLITSAITGLLLILLPAPGQTASFDCQKASSQTEMVVCESSMLSHLDEELSEVYKTLSTSKQITSKLLIGIQRRALKERDLCHASRQKPEMCMDNWYRKQIFILTALKHFKSTLEKQVESGMRSLSEEIFLQTYVSIADLMYHLGRSDTKIVARNTALPFPLRLGRIETLEELEKVLPDLIVTVSSQIELQNENGELWKSLFFDPKDHMNVGLYSGSIWFRINSGIAKTVRLYRIWEEEAVERKVLANLRTKSERKFGPWIWADKPVHPNCFPYEWLSSDNFKEFSKTYRIPLDSLRTDPTPLYRLGIIPSWITPSWSDKDKITLAMPLSSCTVEARVGGLESVAMVDFDRVTSETCEREPNCKNPVKNEYISKTNSALTCGSLKIPKSFDCIEVRHIDLRIGGSGSYGDERVNAYYALIDRKDPKVLWLGESPKQPPASSK